jgi:hypothetical protein
MADKNLPGRARVIYQSEALYAGTVDATGHHFADGNVGKATDVAGVDKTGIQQLRRVQSANYSFSINRQDVNQFGQLARVDSVSIEPPTVTLDFSYYLTNGINERLLGMNVSGKQSALSSEIMDGVVCGESVNAAGKNFFILTTCEGKDAVGADTTSSDNKSVIALGNGFVSNYSIEAAVGGMPTANVTVDGLNLKSYTGCKDLEIPAVNTNYGTPITDVKFSIPPAVSGVLNDSATDTDAESEGWSCLRPGDITLSLGTDGRAAEFELLPGEDPRGSEGYGDTVGGFSAPYLDDYSANKEYNIGDRVKYSVATTAEQAAAAKVVTKSSLSNLKDKEGNALNFADAIVAHIKIGDNFFKKEGAFVDTVLINDGSLTLVKDQIYKNAATPTIYYKINTLPVAYDAATTYVAGALAADPGDSKYYKSASGAAAGGGDPSSTAGWTVADLSDIATDITADIKTTSSTYWTKVGVHIYKSLTAENKGNTPGTADTANWDIEEAGVFNDGSSVGINDNPQKDYSVAGSAHIQSFSIDVPLSRSVLNRLGSPYGYSRVVDYPVNISISVNAILADLKKGDVAELLWNTEEHDLVFTMREPAQMGDGPVAMQYVVKGALLEGESFSSSIGDNKSVDLTFTAQVGAPDDKARGLFILGSRNALDVENLPGWYSG